MTRVLVTGARGFIGRHVMAAFAQTGVDLHGVTSGTVPPGVNATWHRADLLDPSQAAAVVRVVKPDTVLHLAWCAKPPDYWRDLDNARWTAASLELARVFAEAGGRRFVGVGSCAEYAWPGHCVERSTPIAPTSLYGAAKAAFGSVLDAFAPEAGIEAAWARIFFLLGPHDAPTRLVPSIVRRLAAGEPAACTSGNHVRDYLYIVDAAEALVALCASAVPGPVNIASGVPVRLGDLAAGVAARMGRPDLIRIADRREGYPRVTASVERLNGEVGWSPRFSLDTAIEHTVRWWTSADGAVVA